MAWYIMFNIKAIFKWIYLFYFNRIKALSISCLQEENKKSEPAAEVGAGNSKNQKKKEKARLKKEAEEKAKAEAAKNKEE